MDKFAAIEALIAVIESGSFQAASERLGIAKSVVSRRVSQLEENLGTRLLHRTTRSLSLTDEGMQFYQRSVQIMADLQDAELETTNDSSEIRGRLKLAAPLSFGLAHLSSAIANFLKLHPAVELEMDLNDRNVNLVEEGFDMAVRIGELEDSTLIARRIGTSRNVTCASPAYIAKNGSPETPENLSGHIGLQYTNMSYKRQWQYQSENGQTVWGQPHIRIRANNGEALASAAVEGLGIWSGPSFILAKYINTGELVTILEQFQQPAVGIYALYPPGRLMPHRIKLFSDYLATYFGEHPYWEENILPTH